MCTLHSHYVTGICFLYSCLNVILNFSQGPVMTIILVNNYDVFKMFEYIYQCNNTGVLRKIRSKALVRNTFIFFNSWLLSLSCFTFKSHTIYIIMYPPTLWGRHIVLTVHLSLILVISHVSGWKVSFLGQSIRSQWPWMCKRIPPNNYSTNQPRPVKLHSMPVLREPYCLLPISQGTRSQIPIM